MATNPLLVEIALNPGAVLPEYQTPQSAGMDLCCTEDFTLAPLERKMVGTGLRIAVPEGYEAQIRPRSGLAIRHGISMVNTPGTIDADYRGEIKVLLINLGAEAVRFDKGDRIGQMVICPVMRAEWRVVDALGETERGAGGFGSTGV